LTLTNIYIKRGFFALDDEDKKNELLYYCLFFMNKLKNIHSSILNLTVLVLGFDEKEFFEYDLDASLIIVKFCDEDIKNYDFEIFFESKKNLIEKIMEIFFEKNNFETMQIFIDIKRTDYWQSYRYLPDAFSILFYFYCRYNKNDNNNVNNSLTFILKEPKNKYKEIFFYILLEGV